MMRPGRQKSHPFTLRLCGSSCMTALLECSHGAERPHELVARGRDRYRLRLGGHRVVRFAPASLRACGRACRRMAMGRQQVRRHPRLRHRSSPIPHRHRRRSTSLSECRRPARLARPRVPQTGPAQIRCPGRADPITLVLEHFPYGDTVLQRKEGRKDDDSPRGRTFQCRHSNYSRIPSRKLQPRGQGEGRGGGV